MDVLGTPSGDLELTRRPDDPRLRAFDAADALLLEHLREVDLTGTVVVLNDRWGALTTALAPHGVVSVSDSWVARESTWHNLARAGREAELRSVVEELPERVDVLVFRVPRTLALLEHELDLLAPRLHDGSVVVGAGMTKEVHTSTLATCEQLVGPTRTSLATRKARLIHVTVDAGLQRPPNPWPRSRVLPADAPAGLGGATVVHHAGVFSADHLDIGTRFLLEHLPRSDGRVVDLGCGDGVLGVAAGLASPQAQVVLTDASFLAVESARTTWRGVHGDRPVETMVGDGLTRAVGPVDLVLCNPPFHVGHAVSDTTAWRMFDQARHALVPGGELWVVGNRHLGHHARLGRLFGGCDVVASNAKFVVLRAVAR
ncbi:methyltransferase [Rhodococcus antarcticus]|uniref:Methyltransferase n=1 Tax=Rhodococcus antarcticus TaxID=2987751 RepID=A0ABY6NY92_9NOCA|nr:methyltransferase [Rhodococcus antarcticus]UZJ24096.1 methyltransferase [Rhodococcus antarcticus]